MLSQIDHVILATADFEAASQVWGERLGFRLTDPGGHAAYGTRNRAVPFPKGYVELITIVEPEVAARSPLGQALAAAIAGPERWFGFALASSDIEADVAALRAGGSSATEIMRGEWQGPDGSTLSWRYAVVTATDGLPVPFILQYDRIPTEAVVASAAYGVESIREVVLAVPDVAAAMTTFQREFRLRASLAGDVAVIGLTHGRILLAPPGVTGLGMPGVYSVGLHVTDLAAAHAQLRERGIAAEPDPLAPSHALRIDPQATAGARLRFVHQ